MPDTIASQIEADAIAGVQRVAVDGQSVDMMSIDDRIKAQQFVARQQAVAAGNPFGWFLRKAVPTRSQ